jgi:hypothetical protein
VDDRSRDSNRREPHVPMAATALTLDEAKALAQEVARALTVA